MFSEWIFKITEWIGEIKYRLPSLFTDEEKSILILVFVMIVMLPAVLCILRRKPLVRGMALAVFAFYILGNLSFTILGRDVIYAQKLPTFGNYRQAFYLDYSLFDTLRMLPQGVSSTMEHVHINNYTAAKEVFLNILLYIPMGYLLPLCDQTYALQRGSLHGSRFPLQLRDGIRPASLEHRVLSGRRYHQQHFGLYDRRHSRMPAGEAVEDELRGARDGL